MLVSEDRINFLAHLVCDGIWKDDLVDYEDEDKVLKELRKFMHDYFSKDEKVDKSVKDKIATLKKAVYEGSDEWNILYKKYYDEEFKKIL